VGVALLMAALMSRAPAQEGKDAAKDKQPAAPPAARPAPPPPAEPPSQPAEGDYRQFFKKPQTPAEFWKALQFELEVGRGDLAAELLHGLVDSKPSDEALVDLVDREGMAALLRLRNLKPWVPTPKFDFKDADAEIAKLQKSGSDPDRLGKLLEDAKRARKEAQDAATLSTRAEADTETLIAAVTEATRKVRGDPRRIGSLITQLSATPEEAAYAFRELHKSGALAVPQMIEALRSPTATDRAELLSALQRLGSDVVPPMVAALDGDDVQLKVDLLDVLRRRFAREAVPNLWFLAASPAEPEIVRRKATETLAALLDTQPSRLPPAKVALTREAERYDHHQVIFPNPTAVVIWRWDNGRIVPGWPGAPTVPATAAEEYWGIRFANQALRLDPAYRPARVALLNIVLDKGTEKAGVVQPLAKGAPRAHALLASTNPELVDAVLERALDERRTPVVLNAVRTLGGLADPRAGRPSVKGEPVLIRALYYPDRRVQMAAAEAVLRGPETLSQAAAGRVVEVLRRVLAAEPAAANVPKVLVAFPTPEYAGRVAGAVRSAGFEPVTATTGREVMRRLGQAADIDLLLIDAALPDPGLAGLLGQLNADVHAGHLPIILTAAPEREGALRRYAERDPRVFVAPAGIALAPAELKALVRSRLADSPSGPPLSAAELQDYAERAIRHLNALAHGIPPGGDVRPAAEAILDALRAGKLTPEGQLAAISAVGKLFGARAQHELVAVVLNGQRPVPVRVAATRELIRHIQQNGALLSHTQAGAIESLFADAATDPALKAELALVLGSLKPDERVTGERLLRHQPAPPPPAPALKEDKEKEKD
jgi:CheY-like chemotaxis protein